MQHATGSSPVQVATAVRRARSTSRGRLAWLVPVLAAALTAACGAAGPGDTAAVAAANGLAPKPATPTGTWTPTGTGTPTGTWTPTGTATTTATPTPSPTRPAGSAAACEKVAKAKLSTGPAPVQYTKGWTPAPTKGCTFTDTFGRKVTLTAPQNRMLYRVNEMRRLQNAKDGKKRPMLYPDYCLMELAQGYADTKPSGHNPLLTKLYKWGAGNFSGTHWIQENYGMTGGVTSNPLIAVDKRIYGWFTSGDLKTGHYGTMMNPVWASGGMGLYQKGSLSIGLQTFSNKPAMYTYSNGKKCSKPPKPLSKNSTVPPIGNPPNQRQP